MEAAAEPVSAQAGRPAGSIQPSSLRAWPIGLLGAVAIVLLAEAYVTRRRDELCSIYSVEWRQNARSIRRNAAGSAVLCFGTSLSRMGVAPRVIEERTGMPAYNFAASGAQPFLCYTALRDALARGRGRGRSSSTSPGPPSASPMSSTRRAWSRAGRSPSSSSGPCAARDASLFGRMMTAWALPSYHARPEIRANIGAALRGEEPERNAARFLYARNAEANRGACHLGSVGYDGKVDPANPVMFPKDWTCTAASLAYIEKFLATADSRGIPVFWVLPPMVPEAGLYWASSGTRARYMAMAESFAARHPGVTLVDATTARYPTEAFNDPVHLNRDGAVVFSADLSDVIRSRAAREGGTVAARVGLPDYRPDRDAARVEDSRATLAKITRAMEASRR